MAREYHGMGWRWIFPVFISRPPKAATNAFTLLRHLRHADLFLGGRESAELWLACRDDQTTRRVLTATADLAAVCAPLEDALATVPAAQKG
jgi:hypothetical protein